MKFRSGQLVKLNPRLAKEGTTLAGLVAGKVYPIYSVIPETNEVMFMGVTEHYVNANLLVRATKKRPKKAA